MAFEYKKYEESDDLKKLNQKVIDIGDYKESQAVSDIKQRHDALDNNPIADWTGGAYGDAIKQTMNKINNREKFSYDLNGDALYQQYKDQYINAGRMAMQDTMGQASAMTGGFGNSYAATAGNQAYQGYLQQLNNVVPDLYQLALSKYNQEGQELKDQFSMYGQLYDTEYGEHRDAVADRNAELQRLANEYNAERQWDYGLYSDKLNTAVTERDNLKKFEYGQYTDDYNREFANYQQSVAEKQADQSDVIEALKEQLSQRSITDEITAFDADLIGESDWLDDAEVNYTRRTVGNRGNTGNGGAYVKSYKYDGKNYENYSDYIKSVLEDKYRKQEISPEALKVLLSKYGL